jgi:hypothetical protein
MLQPADNAAQTAAKSTLVLARKALEIILADN